MKHVLRMLLAVTLLLVFSAAAWAFSDTADLSTAEQQALTHLNGLGVVGGYPDDTFRPGNIVTRAEFAKMLCVYAGKTELNGQTTVFSDVLPGAWYFGWVGRAAEQGWLTGDPDGGYRPQDPVSREEITVALARLTGGEAPDIDWATRTEASRILACQMFFATTQTSPISGLVVGLKEGAIAIKDSKDKITTYTIAGTLLPKDLILGSYLELEVIGDSAVRVGQAIIPKRGSAYWDVALDGKSVVIDDKKYDISEAVVFAVEYTLSKPYSSETFVKGGRADRSMLSLGGRLAAEMAVVLDESGSTINAVYLVNASINIAGGRLDVVDGPYSDAKGTGIYFLGREAGLPLASGLATPAKGLFIHYTFKNNEINQYTELLNLAADTVAANIGGILTGGNEETPTAWVAKANGRPITVVNNIAEIKPLVVNLGGGNRTLQLGTDEQNCTNYWLAAGCLVYEVKNGNISQGSRSSIEKGQNVIALVNRASEICYLFCYI